MSMGISILLTGELILLMLTFLAFRGLLPLLNPSVPRDVRLFALSMTCYIFSGTATGIWGAILAVTPLTVPTMIAPGIAIGTILLSGGVIGLYTLFLFFLETISEEERPRWKWWQAPFYPRHPADSVLIGHIKRMMGGKDME